MNSQMNIEYRKAKVKEIKPLLEKIEKVFESLGQSKGTKGLVHFIGEHFDEVVDIIKQFTNLDQETIEEMDIEEAIRVLEQVLRHNRIPIDMIKNFFKQRFQKVGTTIQEKDPFKMSID